MNKVGEYQNNIPCEDCRYWYSLKDEEPPCEEKCPVLKTDKEIEYAKVYLWCRGQLIVGFDQVIDINYLAIDLVMDYFEVINKKECFEMVVSMFRDSHMLQQNQSKKSPEKLIEEMKKVKNMPKKVKSGDIKDGRTIR